MYNFTFNCSELCDLKVLLTLKIDKIKKRITFSDEPDMIDYYTDELLRYEALLSKLKESC